MPESTRPPAQTSYGVLFDGRYLLADGRWEGAVGVVRAAYDTWADDRRVVIKHPDPYTGPQVRAYKEQLLSSEAHVLALLEDVPQVCRLLAQGRVGQGPGSYGYLVIEWAEGRPVADLLQHAAREGAVIPIGSALEILCQLAHVLSEAHGRGIINNDVDVKHLYWDEAHTALKVIDWGNAKTDSSPDWGAFGFHDDLEQFAEAMFSILTGRPALDVAQADASYWRGALRDVIEPARGELVAIGSRLTQRPSGYGSAADLVRALQACSATFDGYLQAPLGRVDRLLEEGTPESLGGAESILRHLETIAPAHRGVRQRLASLSWARQERKEAVALQLGAAYVKAGSWLGAVQVLSESLGNGSRPDSDPALLLAAAMLLDSRRGTISKEAQEQWVEAARAIAERRHEDALDAYLRARGEWFDTKVEPLRSLLAKTGRYVFRHEVRTLAEAIAHAEERQRSAAVGRRSANSELARDHQALIEALAALETCPEHDWVQQRQSYARIARVLEAFKGQVQLTLSLRGELRAVARQANALVSLFEEAEHALARHDFRAASAAMLRIPRIDPDNPSPALHARYVPELEPLFASIRESGDWGRAVTSRLLSRRALEQISRIFEPLPGSTLAARASEMAAALIAEVVARHESQHVEEGLRLLRQYKWSEAHAWAQGALEEHPDWDGVRYAAGLAEAYVSLFDPAEPLTEAPLRAEQALAGLDALRGEGEELLQHRRRIGAMAACFRHLLTLEEDRHSLARKALDDLARGDPHREDLRLGIDLTHELRVALGEKRWDRAREMLVRLRATDMPIIPQLVQDWDTALSQVAEAIGHRRVRQYQEALTGLEGAIAAIPDVFIGRPAPTPAEMREELQQLRDVVAQEMQALTRAATTPAGPSATARRPTISSDGGAKVGGAIVSRVRSLGRTAQSNYARLSRLVHDNEPHPGGGLGDQFRSWLDRLTERLRGAAPKRPFDESEPAPELVTSEPDQSAPVAVAVRTRKRARHPRPKPQTETSRSSGDLWESASWAMGGALMVGVVTLLFALNSGMRSADRARVPLPASATGQTIGRMVELLRANDVEAAAALLVRVRAEEPSRLTVEQQRQLDAVSDCIWLWERQEQPASALQREDLARLNELWVAVQSAEGRQSLEAVCPPGMNAEESIRAQAGARWEQLQLLMRQDSNEAYEAIVAALDGLQDASLSILCGGDTVFRETLMRAHAGLARRRFEAYACEAGSQQIGDILQLLEGHQELARLEELRPLNGLQERCWRLQEDCKALARLQSDDGLTSPGDDLLVLANLEPRWDDIRQACGDVSLQALVKNRLDALWKMVEDGDIARARVEALKLAGHEWFVRPPAAQHSPAVISVAAAALLVEQECDRGGCGQEADDVLATAQRTYEGFSEAMSPEVRERLMELMQEARARCETCEGQLAAAPAAPTPTTPVVVGTPVSRPPAVAPAARTLSLLDPDLGGWKDVGVYFGTTEHGRVWYLYDRFVKTYAAPLLYDSADQDRQYQLYRTEYQPSERQLDAVTSIRVRSKVLSIKESLEDTKPLWGIRMAGSGDQAVYLLIMWGPGPGGDEARGAWALSLWSPGSEGSGEYGLPPGPSGVTTEIRIERAPDGSAFDVYWQDELALAQQPLPAPGDLRQVEFLVGEGVHIWLRAAEIGLGR